MMSNNNSDVVVLLSNHTVSGSAVRSGGSGRGGRCKVLRFPDLEPITPQSWITKQELGEQDHWQLARRFLEDKALPFSPAVWEVRAWISALQFWCAEDRPFHDLVARGVAKPYEDQTRIPIYRSQTYQSTRLVGCWEWLRGKSIYELDQLFVGRLHTVLADRDQLALEHQAMKLVLQDHFGDQPVPGWALVGSDWFFLCLFRTVDLVPRPAWLRSIGA